MVAGPQEVDPCTDTATNKAPILKFTKLVLQESGHDKVSDLVPDDIIQHATTIGAGRTGLKAMFASDQ